VADFVGAGVSFVVGGGAASGTLEYSTTTPSCVGARL
jgi:hypothetical protein